MVLVQSLMELEHRLNPQYVVCAPDFAYLANRPAGEYFLSHIRKLPLPTFPTINEAFEAARNHGVTNTIISKAIFSKNVPQVSEEGPKATGVAGNYDRSISRVNLGLAAPRTRRSGFQP